MAGLLGLPRVLYACVVGCVGLREWAALDRCCRHVRHALHAVHGPHGQGPQVAEVDLSGWEFCDSDDDGDEDAPSCGWLKRMAWRRAVPLLSRVQPRRLWLPQSAVDSFQEWLSTGTYAGGHAAAAAAASSLVLPGSMSASAPKLDVSAWRALRSFSEDLPYQLCTHDVCTRLPLTLTCLTLNLGAPAPGSAGAAGWQRLLQMPLTSLCCAVGESARGSVRRLAALAAAAARMRSTLQRLELRCVDFTDEHRARNNLRDLGRLTFLTAFVHMRCLALVSLDLTQHGCGHCPLEPLTQLHQLTDMAMWNCAVVPLGGTRDPDWLSFVLRRKSRLRLPSLRRMCIGGDAFPATLGAPATLAPSWPPLTAAAATIAGHAGRERDECDVSGVHANWPSLTCLSLLWSDRHADACWLSFPHPARLRCTLQLGLTRNRHCATEALPITDFMRRYCHTVAAAEHVDPTGPTGPADQRARFVAQPPLPPC